MDNYECIYGNQTVAETCAESEMKPASKYDADTGSYTELQDGVCCENTQTGGAVCCLVSLIDQFNESPKILK